MKLVFSYLVFRRSIPCLGWYNCKVSVERNCRNDLLIFDISLFICFFIAFNFRKGHLSFLFQYMIYRMSSEEAIQHVKHGLVDIPTKKRCGSCYERIAAVEGALAARNKTTKAAKTCAACRYLAMCNNCYIKIHNAIAK